MATNIIVNENSIILDGHQDNNKSCETMTLMAKALKESKDFNCVVDEKGYAEFKKVGEAESLQFPAAISVYGLGLDIDAYLYIEGSAPYIDPDKNIGKDATTALTVIEEVPLTFKLSSDSNTYVPLNGYKLIKATDSQSVDTLAQSDGTITLSNADTYTLTVSQIYPNIKLGENVVEEIGVIKIKDADNTSKYDVYVYSHQE